MKMQIAKDMPRRKLGRTGFELGVLGLGGHTYPVGEGADCFATPDERAALVRALVEAGTNYFDTTWLNEVELLADSFKRLGLGTEPVVSLQHVDGISDPHWREKLRREIETRLTIMGYTAAPLFIMGVGNEDVPYAEIAAAAEALARYKAEGLVRNIGMSCHQFSKFPLLAKLIEETDLPDYLMVRFNWKYPQANEALFPVAQAHDVGIVLMKVFCWDCGPGQWGRRISVFEPAEGRAPVPQVEGLSPAQRSLIWDLQNAPAAVVVPAINAMWEVEQDIAAVQALDVLADTSDFAGFSERLWQRSELEHLAREAESATIRERARLLVA
jgi:predicted aldo/keto reductase-like oxidoreductase